MPAAPLFEAKPYKADVWRLVEAQHRVSTLKLTDSLDEQALLESMIEKTKPPLPPQCEGLDYLLAAPFRYGAVYPAGSRFRRAGMTAGVFYASERVETAVAEVAFYRLLFYAESPETPFPDAATGFSAFAAKVMTERSIDISRPPFDTGGLMHLNEYSACQMLEEAARKSGIDVIRYPSVRDPKRGANVAVLSPLSFANKHPVKWQTWRIRISASGVSALCDFPVIRLSFDRGAFAEDPRLAGFVWERR
jgi:RES domain